MEHSIWLLWWQFIVIFNCLALVSIYVRQYISIGAFWYSDISRFSTVIFKEKYIIISTVLTWTHSSFFLVIYSEDYHCFLSLSIISFLNTMFFLLRKQWLLCKMFQMEFRNECIIMATYIKHNVLMQGYVAHCDILFRDNIHTCFVI